MKCALLTLLFVATVAVAQGNTGQSTTGLSRGNGLRVPQYRTSGTTGLSFFVETTGNDANDCRSISTPCLTPQGALNKAPRMLRDSITLNMGAGNFPGFYLSGFTQDSSYQTSQGGAAAGVLVSGTRVTSTLATGTASGTATGGTGGNGATTFGTLLAAAQTWTVNDLRGRFVRITGGTGSGQNLVIYSNTATSLTVSAGTWTAPDATSTYVIEDPATIITTPVRGPGSPTAAGQANAAGIYAGGNAGLRATVRDVRVSVTAVYGIDISGGGTITLQRVQIFSGPTSASVKLSDFQPAGAVTISQLYSVTSNAISHVQSFDNAAKSTASLSGLVLSGGTAGIEFGSLTVSACGNIGMVGITGMGISGYNFSMWDGIQAVRIDCASSAGIGAGFGAAFAGSVNQRGVVYGNPSALIFSLEVATCGTGIAVLGPASVAVNALAGTAATTGFDIRNGGFLSFDRAGVTLTAGTNEIDIDSGGATGTFTSVAAGTCLATAGFASRACGR